MSVNNNHQPKNIKASSSIGNNGMINPNLSSNFSTPSQPQGHPQIGVSYQGQFHLAQAQTQAIAQAQSKAVHVLQSQGLLLNHSQNLGVGSLGTPSPPISTAGNVNAKRLPQKPPLRPPGPPATNIISPLKSVMELTPAAQRKKQKLPEKQLHYRVASLLPESALYTQLLEFESRVDAALTRKKIDIQEALRNPPCVQKTLRIYIFNTFANQTKTTLKKLNAEPPTWTLKIIGRIMEEGVDPELAAVMKPNPMFPKFSAFFKRVTITLEKMLYPDNHLIVWDNSRTSAHHEGFEVKRKGDKEFTATIRLEMNYVPEKFKLSAALMEVLGIEVDTRPRIIAAIWHYVKARKLQNQNDPSYFNCDPPLWKVFGVEMMKFTMVSQKISPHLSPPQPIQLEHNIKLSGSTPAGDACYDVLVDIPFPIQRELNMLLANTEKNKEMDACDEAICAAIRKIHEHHKRRAFFIGFSQSPVEFINTLIESQSRDLKLVSGEPCHNAERERPSDFFNQPWVEDAVIRYLTRKPAAGTVAPEST
ncbi:hypothetical protein Nepgr_008681 [Nepenthes gracilis]|uniref:DM2 domain-containing protein n=1 Tax=Nepenthes gracilis TaxID=150966 RepID=A0AAD3XJP3_NEPGR|nr:hypothetical protein Nepgr_008681 [Nepenthes gracilis]